MYRQKLLITTKFLVSISKLIAPPLDEVVCHGGASRGRRRGRSQSLVARHTLRSRTHPALQRCRHSLQIIRSTVCTVSLYTQ